MRAAPSWLGLSILPERPPAYGATYVRSRCSGRRLGKFAAVTDLTALKQRCAVSLTVVIAAQTAPAILAAGERACTCRAGCLLAATLSVDTSAEQASPFVRVVLFDALVELALQVLRVNEGASLSVAHRLKDPNRTRLEFA